MNKSFVRLIVVFVFIIFSIQIKAQNYRSLVANDVSLYTTKFNNIYSSKMDSMKVINGDSVCYFSKSIGGEYGCATPYGNAWIGNRLIICSNGNNIYINSDEDSILIKTNAIVGEQWLMYDNQSLKIYAKVSSIIDSSFLGLNDSVKTIEFECFNNQNIIIDTKISGFKLKLSKKFGFIQLLNFNVFPEVNSLSVLSLCGLSKTQVGIQNLTWFDVFDFQVGDEIHIKNTEYHYRWEDRDYYNLDTRYIYNYIERVNYSDSIVYKIARTKDIKSHIDSLDKYTFIQDTIILKILKNNKFDELPKVSVIESYFAYEYSMGFNYNTLTKTEPSEAYQIHSGYFDNCWDNCCFDGCAYDYVYVKGLGGPYYYCSDFYYGIYENALVYYKKGNVSWGKPMVINGINEIENSTIAQLYPNPADNLFVLETPLFETALLFEISDVDGNIVKHLDINSRKVNVDISDLKSGLYFYDIRNSEGLVQSGKLIKK